MATYAELKNAADLANAAFDAARQEIAEARATVEQAASDAAVLIRQRVKARDASLPTGLVELQAALDALLAVEQKYGITP